MAIKDLELSGNSGKHRVQPLAPWHAHQSAVPSLFTIVIASLLRLSVSAVSEQPSLIVNDLKRGASRRHNWVVDWNIGRRFFSNLRACRSSLSNAFLAGSVENRLSYVL